MLQTSQDYSLCSVWMAEQLGKKQRQPSLFSAFMVIEWDRNKLLLGRDTCLTNIMNSSSSSAQKRRMELNLPACESQRVSCAQLLLFSHPSYLLGPLGAKPGTPLYRSSLSVLNSTCTQNSLLSSSNQFQNLSSLRSTSLACNLKPQVSYGSAATSKY